MEDKIVIFVAGMHRSGTSAVTNAIAKTGFSIGKDPLPSNDANPTGYYEDKAVIHLNDEVLAQLNLTWWDAVVDPWLSHDGIENNLADRARKLLLSYLDDCPKLLLKDPRFCITAPFWLEVLNSIEVKHGWIFVYREPTKIMGSLARRDGFSSAHTALLTYSYWISALNYLRGCPREILRFEDFAEDPFNVIVRVLENLGVDTRSASESLVNTALKKDLIHSHKPGLPDPQNRHLQDLLRLYKQLVESGGFESRLVSLVEGLVPEWQKTSLSNTRRVYSTIFDQPNRSRHE